MKRTAIKIALAVVFAALATFGLICPHTSAESSSEAIVF
jgi:hypothetical protein